MDILLGLRNLSLLVEFGNMLKHAKTGFAILSAFRNERSEKKNLEFHKGLMNELRMFKLGFWEVDGVYQDKSSRNDDGSFNKNSPRDEELSVFVPYNPANFRDFDEFAEIIDGIGEGFAQDAVLLSYMMKVEKPSLFQEVIGIR